MLLPDGEGGQGNKLVFIKSKVSAVTLVKVCLLYQNVYVYGYWLIENRCHFCTLPGSRVICGEVKLEY